MNIDEVWFAQINAWAGQFSAVDWLMFQVSQESNLLIPGIVLVGYWGWTKWGEAKIGCFPGILETSPNPRQQLGQPKH